MGIATIHGSVRIEISVEHTQSERAHHRVGEDSAGHHHRRRGERFEQRVDAEDPGTLDGRSRESGKVLWSADLALPFLAPDRKRIIASVTGPIIDAIGRDIKQQRFEIR